MLWYHKNMKYRLLFRGLSLLFLSLICLILVSQRQFTHSKSDQPSRVASDRPAAISGLVVPHHDLVKEKRAELLREVAGKIAQPKTVILVSPNHYESGRGHIQTNSQLWQLAEGSLLPDLQVIQSLIKAGATEEPVSFSNEHGIKLLLPDLAATFPQAKIVPIILKRQTSLTELTALQNSLLENCRDCLMVASVDFSHYQAALLAELHDSLSQRALEQLDTEALFTKAETDSPAALALLTLWAKAHQTEQFVLKNHTNSGIIGRSPDIETTTHLFGWYQSGSKVQTAPAVSFLIGGDMMFGRLIAHTFLAEGLWRSLDQLGERVFWGTDAGAVNLEGPVSDRPVPDNTEPNNLVFHFPPETIDALKYLKVNGASLANNHSANAGRQGLATTRQLLESAQIKPIGGPAEAEPSTVMSVTGHDLTLKIIGVHTLSSVPDITEQIKKLKADPHNRVLIFPHWGSEYQSHHSNSQAEQAHGWIEAGADLVVGAHPHVIQDLEIYKGKPIIYSLGNLLFDQTFSLPTQQGLIVAGQFTADKLSLFALPVQSNQLKPSFVRGLEKAKILDTLYRGAEPFRHQTPAGEVLELSVY